MIFTFHGVPQAQPADLTKSFDSLQTSPEISNKIQEITTLRNNFFATLGQATTKPLQEMITSLDWMPLIAYLNTGPDLLEIGVKKANYPFIFNYQPFTFPSKVINISNDNEIAVTAEILFSRYLYSLGMLRSCSGLITELRKAKTQGNNLRCGEMIKNSMERISNATIRLLKLKASEKFIFPGLKGRTEIPEFTQDFLNVMICSFEVNFASLFLEKLFLAAGNPAGIKVAASISSQSLRKIQQIRDGFSRFNCSVSSLVVSWCEIASIHFRIMAYWSLYQENEFMTQRVIEKTKDVETIYFQNNILANRILDLRIKLTSLMNSVGNNDMFNLKESAKHSLSLINQAQEYSFKKAITTFENIKGDLNLRKFTGVTPESLLSTVDHTQDKIKNHLMKMANLSN